MKKSALLLVAALTALAAGPATGADMAVKAVPQAAPVFTWTGCYVGVHAGGGVLLDQGFQFGGGLNDKHGIGGLAGGQVGCNYQSGMLVLGIEGEGFWSGMKVTSDFFGGTTLVTTTTIRNNWDYDVAARIGVAFDRALVYGKAGWVAAGFDWYSAQVNFCGLACPVTRGSATLDGLLIGVGLEYAFTNNWTVKFEYDYLGFGARNVNFVTVQGPATFNQIQSVSADKHIFKVGVNYLFNTSPGGVVARY